MTDFYLASDNPTTYPRKLQKPEYVRSSRRDPAETFIMDSGIGDDTTNADVLNLAAEYDADYVVPCDVLHDQAATTASVREFMDLYADHPTDATPLVPLQPPHAEHYRDLPGFNYYALGGMALERIDDSQAVRWIRDFRQVVGSSAYVHAFGIGGGIGLIRQVAGEGLLDSADCATPELAAMYGCVLDEQLRQRRVRVSDGDGVNRRNTPLATFNAWQVQDVWDREAADSAQRTLPSAVEAVDDD